jgi:predicted molibdopterin-dependent oxidoreductase YjgC
MITIRLDGEPVTVPEDISVAGAIQRSGRNITRRSVRGQPRTAFCGMGVCQECRVQINGVRKLACQTTVVAGMQVERVDNRAEELSET